MTMCDDNVRRLDASTPLVLMQTTMMTTTTMTPSCQHSDYRIALYYSYVKIDNVAECIARQQDLCLSLSLKGRIRISFEGINGVLSGLFEDLRHYQQETCLHLNQQELDVKYCYLREDLSVESQLFDALSIKETREVISLFEHPSPPNTNNNNNNEVEGEECEMNDGRSRRGRRRKQQRSDDDEHDTTPEELLLQQEEQEPAPHLSPHEWNAMLKQHTDTEDAILVDARNMYESRVGHFQVEGIPTLLANTRKYSYLPHVLSQHHGDLKNKRVFLYCTGGVRCERASMYVQQTTGAKQVYQLEGGIQRYLEEYGTNTSTNDETDSSSKEEECLFRGKNFVFDLRRTDPRVGTSCRKGNCVLCSVPHDDYDNGHAPSERCEARCCKCRVLVLCCNSCRTTVRSWGEQAFQCSDDLPQLYCGGVSGCIDDGNNIQSTII